MLRNFSNMTELNPQQDDERSIISREYYSQMIKLMQENNLPEVTSHHLIKCDARAVMQNTNTQNLRILLRLNQDQHA